MSTITTTGTGAVADASAAPPSTKFADKFDTPEALEKGTRELRKFLELETPDGAIVGKDSNIARDTAQLEQHYKELEKHKGKLGNAKAPVGEPGKPADGKPGLEIKPVVEAKPASDVDYDTYVKTEIGIENPQSLGEAWLKDGKLSDADYAKFAAKGHPKSVVDTHMRGLHALAQQSHGAVVASMAEATKIAGGETQLQNLLAWAGNPANIPVAERERLNAQLKADPANYPIIAEMLATRHRMAVGAGKAQPLITGGTSTNPTGGATTREEWIALCKSDKADDAVRLAATVVKPEWTRAK